LSDSAREGDNRAPEASAGASSGEGAGPSPPTEDTPQIHESPPPPNAPGGPSPAVGAPPGDQPPDDAKPVWERVLDFPHLPPPVKRLAERRLNVSHAKQMQRSLSRHDPAENAATRLPPGEQVRVPVIWLAEIFTPTTIDGLVDGMRELAGKAKGTLGLEDDLGEWILSSRRQGRTTRHNVPYIRPRGSHSLGTWFEDQVPAGIAYIHPYLHTLTPTVTVLTAAFRLKDDRAEELEGILNQNLTTRVEMRPKGFSPLSVGLQKDRAADEWRANLRRDAARWLAERFPGSFHKLAPGQLPTTELLLTGRYRPWEPTAQRSDIPEWTGAIGIGGWFEYWQCTTVDYLRLYERYNRDPKSDLRNALVLGAAEQELRADSNDLPTAIASLDSLVAGLLVRWSLTALLRELEEQTPSIQDAADRVSRKPSGRALTKLQEQLLRAGLDSRIVVSDIVRYTQDPMWRYNLLDFSEVIPPLRHTRRQPAVSLLDSLRQGQAVDGQRVLRMEKDLRDVLSTNAELTGAAANIRLMRNTVWIAVASMIIAAVAAFAAVIAILRPNTATSSPSPHATPAAHHSPSAPSTMRPR
jgi:hypothetical protein